LFHHNLIFSSDSTAQRKDGEFFYRGYPNHQRHQSFPEAIIGYFLLQFEGHSKTLKKQGRSQPDRPDTRVFPNLVKNDNDYS